MNQIMEIITQNAPPKKWSERKFKKNKVAFIHKIVKILSWAAGGELRKMMFFLLRVKKYKFSKLTRESRALNKIVPCINKRVRRKHKHCFVKAFKDSNFSKEAVWSLGLKFSQHLWYSCMDSSERQVGGRKGYQNLLKPMIDNFLELNSEIAANRTSLEIIKPPKKRKENGVIIYQKKQRITENARYLNKPLVELQKNFNELVMDNHNNLDNVPSRFTFNNKRSRLFKTAKRNSDMCDYCVLGKTIKKNIDDFIKVHFNELYLDKFDLAYYLREFKRTQASKDIPYHLLYDLDRNYVDEILNIEPDADIPFIEQNDNNQLNEIETETRSEEEYENINSELNIDMDEDDSDDADDSSEPNSIVINESNILKQLLILRQIEFHKTIANKQRESYNKTINDTNEYYHDGITIEMDFKQKIVYGN